MAAGIASVTVTQHAAQRWAERVHPCTLAEAATQIRAHTDAILKAAGFGAKLLKLPSLHRLVLAGTTVITVTPSSKRTR